LGSDCGSSGEHKKKLTGALLGIAQTGATDDEMLIKIFKARAVNLAHGGTVISAWDIDELPEEFVDACDALVNDLPNIKKGTAKIDAHMAKVRSEHPQYRKYKH